MERIGADAGEGEHQEALQGLSKILQGLEVDDAGKLGAGGVSPRKDTGLDSSFKYRTWNHGVQPEVQTDFYGTNNSYREQYFDSVPNLDSLLGPSSNNYKLYATEDYGSDYNDPTTRFAGLESFNPTTDSGVLFSVQTYKSEIPTRSVLTYNVPTSLSMRDLVSLFNTYGDIEAIYPARKADLGVILVVYFDIIDASLAVKKISDPSFPVNAIFSTNLVASRSSFVRVHPYYEDNQLLFLNNNNSQLIHNVSLRYGRVLSVTQTNSGFVVKFSSSKCCARAYAKLNQRRSEVSLKVVPVPVDIVKARLGVSLFNFIKAEQKITPRSMDAWEYDTSYNSSTQGHLGLSYVSTQSIRSEATTTSIGSYSSAQSMVKKRVTPPKDDFKIDIREIESCRDTRSTIMIRNIPNKYTQAMLLQELDDHFACRYDFFYLPIDFKNKCNVGYAFLNVINFTDVIGVHAQFNQKLWTRFNSEKICEVSYAKIQGKLNLVNRFRNSSLMFKEKDCRPLVFKSDGANKGRPEAFPAPDNS